MTTLTPVRGDAALAVHVLWRRLRDLEYADRQLGGVCALVPPSLAPRSATALRAARKSLQGAVRHAARLHAQAQRRAAGLR